jgi:hypothetical protein
MGEQAAALIEHRDRTFIAGGLNGEDAHREPPGERQAPAFCVFR